MAKNLDLYASGLGDLTHILGNQGVADHSWLAVDETDYRAQEALPKQNLDMIPELQKALTIDPDDDVPHIIPMRPHTIVNRNPLDVSLANVSPVDMAAPIRNRVAQLVMASLPAQEIEKRIRLEFAPGDIRLAADSIREVLHERGVIGNVYIDAKHFPRAASDPKERKLASALSKGAIFVIGGCGGKNGCNCHDTGICATFGNKRVVDEVPWGASVASHYAPRLSAEKRPLPATVTGIEGLPVSGQEWKERIRTSFLQSPIERRDGEIRVIQTQPVPVKPKVTRDDIAGLIARKAIEPVVMPSSTWTKYARRMMLGSDDRQFLVASTDSGIRSLAGEYGVLGHTYLDMDVLGGCRGTLALIESRGLSPDFVIRRHSSCLTCNCAEDGACTAISGMCNIVSSKPEVSRVTFASALERAVMQGRIASEQASTALNSAGTNASWDKLTSQANLYNPKPVESKEYTGAVATAFNGNPGRGDSDVVEYMDPEEVRKTLSHLMNLGLSGRALQSALLKRYSIEDLKQVPEIGRRASMDDGVQGHYFIDPTAYRDYGKGCNEGAKHFRKQGATNVLACSSCTGCTLQTAPGWCSKYAKNMIRQVPTQVREHVAAIRKLPVVQDYAPVENPVEKYELASELVIEPRSERRKEIEITITGGSLGD